MDLIKQMKFNKNENILDLGCGTGNLTITLAKGNLTCNIIGIDIGEEMIGQAKKNLQNEKLDNLEFIKGDILDFQPELRFNTIFSNSVIHWIKDKEKLFQKLKNLLQPNGKIGIQIPASKNLSEITPLFMKPIESLKLNSYFKNWKYPMKRATPRKLKKIIDLIGFKNTNIFMKDRKLDFINHEEVLDFLKSAALVPILNSLPLEIQDKYCNVLLDLLKKKGEGLLKITMKRIYIFLEN